MSLYQGFPNTFSGTQQTQEVLKNLDNETKKIYVDVNNEVNGINANLASHITDGVDAHMASAIGNTPSGNISATTEQGAINELDNEKVAKGSLVVNVKDYGVIGDWNGTTGTNDTTALQAVFDYVNTLNRPTVIDFVGCICKVSTSIKCDFGLIPTTLRNGGIHQITEAEDTLKIINVSRFLTLEKFGLSHALSTSLTGSLLHITAELAFFNWIKSNGICSGGKYGVRTHGGTWMFNAVSVWIDNTYSSGWYMPASGDTCSLTAQLGGSTTTKLTNCFVTNVQTEDPAYFIASGYDTVYLDTCSADNCSRFGAFKANPVTIKNCSSENVRRPTAGSITGPHYLLNFGSSYGATVDGFHVVFTSDLNSNLPINTNSLVKFQACRATLKNINGAVPASYYKAISDYGTIDDYSDNIGSLGILNTNGSITSTPHKYINHTNLSGVTAGSGATTLWTFETGDNVYILNTSWSYSGGLSNSVWLITTSSSTARGTAVKLSSGPDYAAAVVISFSGSTVVCTISGANIASTWQCFNLSLVD